MGVKRMSIVPEQPDNMTDGLEQFIADYITPEMTGVEIGCFEGVSTELFAKACGKLFAVDPYDNENVEFNNWLETKGTTIQEVFEKFKERIAQYPNVVFMQDYSQDNHRAHLDESLDFVYIDGAHDYLSVIRDIENFLPKIKSGGIIAGHDWNFEYGQVSQAVMYMLGEPEALYPDTSWVWRKP